MTAWLFLRGQGFAAGDIIVGGDGAGAGLSVALINRLRNETAEAPACLWLVSPWTDLTMAEATMTTKDFVDPLIHEGYLSELAAAYVPAGIDRKDPRVSPLFADPPRPPADLDPGRIGGNFARRRDPVRDQRRRRRRRRHPGGLAAHDPCFSGVERALGAWPPRADAGRRVPFSAA